MTTTATRTFDCPWCGMISPVPIEHMGEHFTCPECKKATKLTAANTSDLAPTEAPPDAPHLVGDRTFDCPWCGAIAAVPSSHLGDRFHCPECGKETKLTAMNTRAAAVTAPPPDAPHVEEAKGGRGLLVAAVVVVLGVGAWLAFGQGGSKESGDSAASTAKTDAAGEPAAAAMTEPTATPSPATEPAATTPSPTGESGMSETGMAETAEPGMAETQPATPSPEAPAPKAPEEDAELLRAQSEVGAATTALAEATAAHTKAAGAIEAWNKAHPGAIEAADAATAIDGVRAEVRQRLTPPADSAAALISPDQARARRAAIVEFLASDPARTRVGERVHAWLSGDLHGREAAAAPDWRSLDWTGAGVARALDALYAAASAVAAGVPANLVAQESATRQSKDAASKRAADAELRVKMLTAPRDDRAPTTGR